MWVQKTAPRPKIASVRCRERRGSPAIWCEARYCLCMESGAKKRLSRSWGTPPETGSGESSGPKAQIDYLPNVGKDLQALIVAIWSRSKCGDQRKHSTKIRQFRSNQNAAERHLSVRYEAMIHVCLLGIQGRSGRREQAT